MTPDREFFGTIRILLVEDNPGDARLIRALLDEAHIGAYELTVAERLAEAIDRLSRQRFEAVLLDLGLPDSDGLDSVRRIREHAWEAPIIVLTGQTDAAVGIEAVKIGAQDYFRKGDVQGNLLAPALRFAIERQHLLNDIEARTQALSESESRFRAFMEASPAAICVKDLDTRYVYANQELGRRMGVATEDLIGRVARDCFPADIANRAGEQDAEVLRQARVFRFEVSPENQQAGVHQLVTKFPIHDADDEIVGLGMVSIDISEQKKAEAALLRSNRSLRTLSACNEALVRSADERHLLDEICRCISEIGQYPLAAVFLLREGEENVLAVESRSGSASGWLDGWYGDIASEGTDCPICTACRTNRIGVAVFSDGVTEGAAHMAAAREAGLASSILLPLVREGEPFGVLGVFSDETDRFDETEIALMEELAGDLAFGIYTRRLDERRKAAEESLRKLSRAVDQSSNIVIITDRRGKIEYVNPKFVEVTGYSAEEAIGNTPHILSSGETDPAEYAVLWDTVSDGGEWRGVFHNTRKDGSLYWAETAISPVRDDSGEITHFIGIEQDVTKKRATENRLRQAEKMESLGSLAGGIAHDFNNMLLPIQALTRLAMRDLPDGDRHKEQLEKVVEAAVRAQELVTRIMAFSRSAEGSKKTVRLADIVDGAAELLRATLPKTIDLSVRVDADVGMIEADSTQIQTVILNLASNSADAMAGKVGHVAIFLDRLFLERPRFSGHTVLHSGDYARLVIEDDGPGIPEANLRRIFEPFFTTKAVGEGTGLGLAMVHGIVTEHGGSIFVESSVGAGATFEILLPLLPDTEGVSA